MKNILAESMRRFGTKNLNEAPEYDKVLKAQDLEMPYFSGMGVYSGLFHKGTGKPNQKIPNDDLEIKIAAENHYEIVFPAASVKPGEVFSVTLQLPQDWDFTVLDKSKAESYIRFKASEEEGEGTRGTVDITGGGRLMMMRFTVPESFFGNKPYSGASSMPSVSFKVDNAKNGRLHISCDCSNLQYYPD
jgi:hypothetical protein|tara:strand:- start:226 stop:792 length:567 start_codon:yes stop_codon:yes gene_type:complete